MSRLPCLYLYNALWGLRLSRKENISCNDGNCHKCEPKFCKARATRSVSIGSMAMMMGRSDTEASQQKTTQRRLFCGSAIKIPPARLRKPRSISFLRVYVGPMPDVYTSIVLKLRESLRTETNRGVPWWNPKTTKKKTNKNTTPKWHTDLGPFLARASSHGKVWTSYAGTREHEVDVSGRKKKRSQLLSGPKVRVDGLVCHLCVGKGNNGWRICDYHQLINVTLAFCVEQNVSSLASVCTQLKSVPLSVTKRVIYFLNPWKVQIVYFGWKNVVQVAKVALMGLQIGCSVFTLAWLSGKLSKQRNALNLCWRNLLHWIVCKFLSDYLKQATIKKSIQKSQVWITKT